MKTFRIVYHRDDLPDYAKDEFQAKTDDEAIAVFLERDKHPNHAWDNMTLYQVSPERRITHNDRMKRYLERDD